MWAQGIKHRSEDFRVNSITLLAITLLPSTKFTRESVFSLLNKQLPVTSCKSFPYDLSKESSSASPRLLLSEPCQGLQTPGFHFQQSLVAGVRSVYSTIAHLYFAIQKKCRHLKLCLNVLHAIGFHLDGPLVSLYLLTSPSYSVT